jgi:hypothetical protein
MVEAINTWLNNGSNYAEGVSIYTRYGSDLFLKIVLKKGETAINRQKLDEALVKLRDTAVAAAPAPDLPPPPVDQPAAPITKSVETDSLEKNDPAKTPALLKLIQERKRTIGEIQSLHPQLSILPEGEKLLELAMHLVNVGKLNAQQWEKYNYLTEGGEEHAPLQPAPAPPVMVDLNLIKKREAIRKSLNKAENRIKGVDKPLANTLALIAQRRQDLQDIDARIAAIEKEAKQ